MKKNYLLFSIAICSMFIVQAQETPFQRGVNLTSWFQAGGPREIQFSKFDKTDLTQIQSLGFDHIRLPINLHFMTDGAPNYRLDPLFLVFLDQVVDWTEELGLYLILDNHTFDVNENTDPNVGIILEKVWRQMAQHYKDRSDKLLYEVLNEPHGISDIVWNSIQMGVVNAIREVDTVHTIVVGGANWNNYNNLALMPSYSDDNMLYTYHFYDPFLFTHQGASWVGPSMGPLAGVPFPYNASEMPSLPAVFQGTWIGARYLSYPIEGSVSQVQRWLDIALNFRDNRNVPIYCGELGVFIPNSDPEDRVAWYKAVIEYLEANDVPWTMWDYKGGFGLFEGGSNSLFAHDLNVPLLEALGMTVPEQSEFVMQPDSLGFFIFDDFIGRNTESSNFNNGSLDYYSEEQPNNDRYCMSWTQAQQYNQIGFDFSPNKDLSVLVANGYALDFFVRGDQPGQRLDIRFMDTKTGPSDRPWRMRITLDENIVQWNQKWQHVHIPLSNFTEHGAWDNAWFPPEGKFDWAAVDRMEIVAEYGDLGNARFWFDNIQLTNEDTAQVNDPFAVSLNADLNARLRVFPNPASHTLTIENLSSEILTFKLMDTSGREVTGESFYGKRSMDISTAAPGVYFLRIFHKRRPIGYRKIAKF